MAGMMSVTKSVVRRMDGQDVQSQPRFVTLERKVVMVVDDAASLH